MPKKVTHVSYAFLMKHDACDDQRDLFREAFGRGSAEINEENVLVAIKAGMQLQWVVYHCKRSSWPEVSHDVLGRMATEMFRFIVPLNMRGISSALRARVRRRVNKAAKEIAIRFVEIMRG